MHPDLTRALTHHEAARLQGFPDYFSFTAVTKRTSLATMIGNAVPPALSKAIFQILIPSWIFRRLQPAVLDKASLGHASCSGRAMTDAEGAAEPPEKYTMRMSLNVLDHWG